MGNGDPIRVFYTSVGLAVGADNFMAEQLQTRQQQASLFQSVMTINHRGRHRRSTEISGFTLIEVIVALLIAAIFTSVTMQALITSAAFRAKATQHDEAFSWIQDDLEAVVTQAHAYEMDVIPYSSRCNAASAAAGVAGGFISESLGGSVTTLGTRDFGGQTFVLERTANVAPSDTMRLVELTYTVTPPGNQEALSTIKSEVIPQAVLRCP